MSALFVIFSGLFGAPGVAGAAVAAHGADTRLIAIAAAIALVHAPALLALAALGSLSPRLAAIGGVLIIAGTVLFSGDLAARFLSGGRLFANAAPLGGGLLIAGWTAVAAGGVARALAGREPRGAQEQESRDRHARL